MNRRERRAAASKSGSSTGARRTPGALFELATRHFESGRLAEAEQCCHEALAIDAGHGDSFHLLGVLASLSHQNDRAVEWFARALRTGPRLDYLKNLGAALHRLGRLDEALKAYDKALTFAPEDAEIWTNIGNALTQAGRYDEAALSFEHALKLNPRSPDAAIGRGLALFKLTRYEEALACFDLVNEIRPDDANVAHMRSTCMVNMRRFDAALPEVRKALAFKPDNADAINNLGVIHQSRDRHEEALPCFDQALALRPDFIEALNNKAFSLSELQQFDKAFAIYARVAALEPDNATMRWNTAMLHLLQGDFEKGWVRRDARWRALSQQPRSFTQPAWRGGEPVEGKTVLLYSDEGLGDTLQYARYVPMLASRGARIILQVESSIRPLLSGMPGVSQCLSTLELPEFDFHCELSALPLAFGTRLETIPAEVPYLRAPADRLRAWEDRLGPHDRLRVGLVWAGNPAHQNDHNRSIAMHMLAPLLDCGARFVSLQKGVRDADKPFLAGRTDVIDLTEDLTDFTETAALVSCLDLVITVDTSVAHLAGALGRPVWVLLPFTPDFRWLLDRDDSPWYPTARLFRQNASREWPDVIERVRVELGEAVASWTPGKDELVRAATQETEQDEPVRAAIQETAMVSINRDLALARKTDTARWSNPNSLQPNWDARAELAAQFIPGGTRVLDLGCGKMALERFLPYGCRYRGCDLVARNAQTIICDFNKGQFPTEAAGDADIIVMLGVLEYILDADAFFAHLRSSNRDVVLSYCATDLSSVDRASLGWITHFSFLDLAQLFDRHGFRIESTMPVDSLQVLMRLTPVDPQTPMNPCSVAVISYNDVGNFGDRLGYHMINSLLPSEASVHHLTFKTLDRAHDSYDLVVLGIGNSVFQPLLTRELTDVMSRGKARVGIFGTQYRELIPRPALDGLIDRLDTWFARYEDDILMYGRGRSNVQHLGDWLINQFPMSTPTEEKQLHIGDEIWNDLPLDRTIQFIQRHKTVLSSRLHPLLCALTSAEAVAYTEQPDGSEASIISGKFRSMLIDIFGRNYPEKTFFPVDRGAVTRYKRQVHDNTAALATQLEAILRNVATAPAA